MCCPRRFTAAHYLKASDLAVREADPGRPPPANEEEEERRVGELQRVRVPRGLLQHSGNDDSDPLSLFLPTVSPLLQVVRMAVEEEELLFLKELSEHDQEMEQRGVSDGPAKQSALIDYLSSRLKGCVATKKRSMQRLYTMVGNAVAFPLAAAIGRCISMAAAGLGDRPQQRGDLGDRRVDREAAERMVDPLWRLAVHEAERRGLVPFHFDSIEASSRPAPQT